LEDVATRAQDEIHDDKIQPEASGIIATAEYMGASMILFLGGEGEKII
jgi:hypothetical protein